MERQQSGNRGQRIGGVVHTYQKYDPLRFPSPTAPPPDVVSPAFEHMLAYGNFRKLTPEELARAVKLDPSQIAGLGPSLDALLAMLEERKRKILEKYETQSVQRTARRDYRQHGESVKPPGKHRVRFEQAFEEEQLYDLERLWYAVGRDTSKFARQIVQLMAALGAKYEIDELAAKYAFRGQTPLTVEEALRVKEELEELDRLIEQLKQAREDAQLAVVDMEALQQFVEPGDIEQLRQMQQMVEDYLRELAERQGLDGGSGNAFQLTPQAYRLFQGKLLERIFSQLEASRTGRHQGPVVGEGAVELQQTKPYEFGDSVAQMDIPQSLINAMLRDNSRPLRLRSEDIEVHRTRNTPKCATVVIMDMSGSMRYDGQYMNVKRMALALDGLIRREYPGDFLHFIEMATFARACPPGEIINLLPKPVTIHEPVVRFRVDMSNPEVSEGMLPPHFTNIQHALRLARQFLAAQDTPNRQIVLITDGLPTAHFDDKWLYLLYPPDAITEQATMREGFLCHREGIAINMFLVPSWSQSEEDIRFAYRLAESTRGRVFFTAGQDLDRFVLWDYVNRRREIIA